MKVMGNMDHKSDCYVLCASILLNPKAVSSIGDRDLHKGAYEVNYEADHF
jgi:hypothetical protein